MASKRSATATRGDAASSVLERLKALYFDKIKVSAPAATPAASARAP